MNITATDSEPCALRAWSDGRMIFLGFANGRIIGFPADRFGILKAASEEELKKVMVEGIVAGRFQFPLPEVAAWCYAGSV